MLFPRGFRRLQSKETSHKPALETRIKYLSADLKNVNELKDKVMLRESRLKEAQQAAPRHPDSEPQAAPDRAQGLRGRGRDNRQNWNMGLEQVGRAAPMLKES